MRTANSVSGFLLFLFAGGALRLYLEKREALVPTIENRFDVPALATLAHQLARSGMEVREAAVQTVVAVTKAREVHLTEQDQQRLIALVADAVYQLERQ